MNESYYNSPNSDVHAQALPSHSKRGTTTAFAWVILVLGFLGLLFSLFNFYAIFQLGVTIDGITQNQLIVDGLLSTLAKIGLLSVGVGLLMRNTWVTKAVIAGFCCSLVDSLFTGLAVVPVQSAAAGSDAESVGILIGFLTIAFISLSIYIGIYFYLRGQASKSEFGFN
ncbi:hypothetical protein FLL45_15155 [Aliikangiella marina]|uniref:Uncharacterized protein n=1 Tax=Aliikangiella marina TaxID=1712262 RepID=A0A545T6J6_9GAMM|nr:hypothetical protein [Aliikangiella marina]TQV72805.1 hypothetical protein FLL45_15155 [Aliikangiella marina]